MLSTSDRVAQDRKQLELRATLASQRSGRAEARRVREKTSSIVERARRPVAENRKRAAIRQTWLAAP